VKDGTLGIFSKKLQRLRAGFPASTHYRQPGTTAPFASKSVKLLIAQHAANNRLGVFPAMIVVAALALIAELLLTMIEDRLLTGRPETTVNE
jgi:hypothetical protein